MKKILFSGVSLVAMMIAGQAGAADISVPKVPLAAPPVWNWTGGYFGLHSGLAYGVTGFSNPYGPSIYGDFVRSPGSMLGAQIGYNWQNGMWVYGVEADGAWINADGTDTCLALNGDFASANCRARPRAIGSLTGRIGAALGPSGRTLLYAKGGLAVAREDLSVTLNSTPTGLTGETTARSSEAGWTVGVGWEEALTPAWSLKVEYGYAKLRNSNIATPASAFFFPTGVPLTVFVLPVAASTSQVSEDFHVFKTGLNYHFGADPWARWPSAAPAAFPTKAPVAPAAWVAGWEFEFGARYFGSSGRWQKDLGGTTNQALQTRLNSRLTYDDLTGHSGEVFGRIESPWNIFAKGMAGGGNLSRGTLRDEDWSVVGFPFFLGQYSNTNSQQRDGDLSYATVDVGYDWLRGPGYKVGGFVGYSYFRESMNAFGCVQTAGNPICTPAIPTSTLVITETAKYDALRVGTAAEVMLLDRLKMTVDAAYVPYMTFEGEDNHVLRSLVSPESGKGQGVQLEAILSYYITPAFSVGMGGRYWALWTTRDAITNFGGAPCPCQTLPTKTERFGAFFQAAYKFDYPGPAPVVAKY